MKNVMRKVVVYVLPVVTLSRTDRHPRVIREIEMVRDTDRYSPIAIVTEPVRPSELLRISKLRFFHYDNMKIYRVPNLVPGRLSTYCKTSTFQKPVLTFLHFSCELVYLLHLTITLLYVVVKERAAIIHANNPPDLTGVASLLVSKITKTRYIFEIYDRTPELYCSEMGFSGVSITYKFFKLVERLVIKNSTAIITVNETTAKHFAIYCVPTVVIYGGWKQPELDSNQSNLVVNEYGHFPDNKKIVLYQGQMNAGGPNKGDYDLELPIKAMVEISKIEPKAVLVYVGDGDNREFLVSYAKKLEISHKVLFTGFVPIHDVFEWIKASEVTLVPYHYSSNNLSTIPNKLLEYMAFGKPIVATKFPGVCEIIKHNYNGLLYDVYSLEEFTKCILTILRDPELASNLGCNARKDFTSRCSFQKNASKLITLYDSIIEKT